MLYLFSLIIVIMGILKKNSKILLYITTIFLLLLLLGGNTNNADRLAYLDNYNSLIHGTSRWGFEFGFQFINKFAIFFGMSYNLFLFMIAVIGLFLITSTILYFKAPASLVIVLYFFYPFIWDTVQLRNFIAMSIIIFGLRYIVSYKKNYLKYIICVLVASTMHVSSLFYLCGILIGIKNSKRTMGIVLLITLLTTFFMSSILKVLSLFVATDKIQAYFFTETSFITKSGVLLFFIISILLVVVARSFIINSNKKSGLTEKLNDVPLTKDLKRKIDPNAVVKMNIICLMTLFLVMNNLDFIRIYRNIFIINYIVFATALVSINKSYKYYLFLISILLFAFMSFYLLSIIIPTTNIFNPVFENNIIFRN